MAREREVADVLDAFGFDRILIETVGVGQTELDIARTADTSLVVLVPESGDSIQTLKAGLMEIADVFVVNKSDHPMALQLQREIRSMMEMLNFSGWVPELVSTQALEGKGIDKLWAAIVRHAAWLRESGAIRDKRRSAFAHRVRQLALGTLERRIEDTIPDIPDDLDPYAAADAVLERFGVHGGVNAVGNTRARSGVRATVKGL